MNTIKKWMNVASFLALLLLGIQPVFTSLAQDGETFAFVNVNIIPMDTEQVLENQTVIVQGDRIVEIGGVDAVSVPPDVQMIDGTGQYLIPGLADAHVHILDNPDSLTLFIANGVTTVRDPNANYVGTGPSILAERDQIAAGELLGPTILAAKSVGGIPGGSPVFSNINQAIGPWLTVDQSIFEIAGDAESGRELVLKAYEEGYDIVKVNWFLNREAFDSIIATADELGMPVLAHVPAQVGIEHAIESGVEIQHNYNVQALVAKDYVRRPGANPLDTFDLSQADEKLPELVALMAENGVAFTPTMVVDVAAFELFDNLPDWGQAPLFQRPEYRYVPPSYLKTWIDPTAGEIQIVLRDSGASSIEEIVPPPAARVETLAYQQRQLKALIDAGVPVLVGTDCSALAVVWGFAIHDELAIFVDAGLTPYQALEAATRIPSEVFGTSDEWGTIEVGKRADLVLLNANPLEDISNTREIAGVMVRGQWLPQPELQGMLDELATKYEAQVAGAIQLEPLTGEIFNGLVPGGWIELEPGIFARSNPEVDPTVLFQLSAPVAARDAVLGRILGNFGIENLPNTPADHVEADLLVWDIYVMPGEVVVALAVAETDTMLYVIAMSGLPDEIDGLAQDIFMPVVTAFTPVQ